VQVSRTAPRIPRFNMPFELGLALSWSSVNPGRHSWFVCDSERHRVLKSISDLAGTDINIHDGRIQSVMRELCNIFVRRSVRPDVTDLLKLYRKLRSVLPQIQRASRRAHSLRTESICRHLLCRRTSPGRSRMARLIDIVEVLSRLHDNRIVPTKALCMLKTRP